jgi:hypothetical protein
LGGDFTSDGAADLMTFGPRHTDAGIGFPAPKMDIPAEAKQKLEARR